MAIFGDLERLIDDIYPYRWLIAIVGVMTGSLLATVAYRCGWHLAIRRHKLRTAFVVVPLLVVMVPLAYYLLSSLWTRTTVFEESPLAAVASDNIFSGAPESTRTPASDRYTTTSEPVVPTLTTGPQPMTEPPVTQEPITEEPTQAPPVEPPPQSTVESIEVPAQASGAEPTPTVFMPRLVSSGVLTGADDFHFAEGTAQLIETEPGRYVLRLDEFSVRNGPDLFVYLSPSLSEFDETAINLGELRATDGSINYDVPPGTDITQFEGVIIWCRAFAVLFGSAPLNAGDEG